VVRRLPPQSPGGRECVYFSFVWFVYVPMCHPPPPALYNIYFIRPWHDIAYLCWKCMSLNTNKPTTVGDLDWSLNASRGLSAIAEFLVYRATLCVSAVFAVARCPSVRLSITLVDCIQTAEDIIKLIHRPGSPIILVVCSRAPVPNSKGDLFSRGAKYTGVGKFCDFRLKLMFISETVRDRPMVAMER